MEVTRTNFQELLPEIEAAIDAADFMSIDGEFTGLSAGSNIRSFDTPADCYHVMRESTNEFLLIQFGLTTFRWDSTSEMYKHCTFIFYIFPKPEYKTAPEKIFSCQSSSIDFLARHKFDFNKLFHEGISYIDTTEETKLRDYTDEKHRLQKNTKNAENDSFTRKHIEVPDCIQPQIDKICKEVEEMVNKKEKKTIEYSNLNSFVRRLVYQELGDKFEDAIDVETTQIDMNNSVLSVSHGFTEKEKLEKIYALHKKELEQIDNIVGFSTVARLISDSRKLVVGHNVCLDILHLVNHFFYPLPYPYKEFKSLTTHVFDSVLDTMYIAKMPPFKNNIALYDLKSLCDSLTKTPFKPPACEVESKGNLKGYNPTGDAFHNAGYDSFIAGYCLLSMFEYLRKNGESDLADLDDNVLNKSSEIFKPFINRLFLYKTSFQGSPCINLRGTDPNPNRDHVFHLTFPKDWSRIEINNLFEPHGGLSVIDFMDDTTAYVALKIHDKFEEVKAALCKAHNHFTLTPYWKYKRFYSIQNSKFLMEQALKSGSPDVVEDIKNNSKTGGAATAMNTIQSFLKRKFKDEDIGEPVSKENVPKTTDAASGSSNNDKSESSGEHSRKPKERRLSHSASGDFVVCDDDKPNADGEEQLDLITVAFRESDNWE